MIRFLIAVFLLCLTQCQTTHYEHVRVGSSYPQGNCDERGQVIGNASSYKDARKKSIDDMRHQAARLDANYVRLVAVASYGSAARGIAYRCR